MRMLTGFSRVETGSTGGGGSSEHGNEPPGSIKDVEFLDKMKNRTQHHGVTVTDKYRHGNKVVDFPEERKAAFSRWDSTSFNVTEERHF
jgi:hypothetical protein